MMRGEEGGGTHKDYQALTSLFSIVVLLVI